MTQIGELERKKLITQVSTLKMAFQAIGKVCISMNKIAKSEQLDKFMTKLVIVLKDVDELITILEEVPKEEEQEDFTIKDTKVPFLKIIERKQDK